MRILLLDDDRSVLNFLCLFLQRLGHDVHQAADGKDGWQKYQAGDYHLVLSDIMMPDLNGLDLLKLIVGQEGCQPADVVLFTANTGVKTAVEAMRAGAYDYLIKPVSVDELVVVLDRVEEHQRLIRQNIALTSHFEESIAIATRETRQELETWKSAYERIAGNYDFVVKSPQMKEIFCQAAIIRDDPEVIILIEGETGTGKDVLARYIHAGKTTAAFPFIDINCAAIPGSLFENELYGYEAGTFTGALPGGIKGKIDLARGGTLFLDEIAEIKPELQAKLLHLLQNREFYPLGGLKKHRLEARIIAATNVDIHNQIENGLFRRDLYYRLSAVHLVVPPLRQRPEDILPLAQHFLAAFSRDKGRHFTGFSQAAQEQLQDYDWPGNVRELKNIIECAVLLNDGYEIKAASLRLGTMARKVSSQSEPGRKPILLEPQLDFVLPPEGFPLQAFNDRLIESALAMNRGNISKTARYLQVSRRALDYRLQKQDPQSPK